MTKRKCGCYDGPYSSETPHILVSVRCQEHSGLPAKNNHSLALIDVKGQVQHRSKEPMTPAQKAFVTNAKRGKGKQ